MRYGYDRKGVFLIDGMHSFDLYGNPYTPEFDDDMDDIIDEDDWNGDAPQHTLFDRFDYLEID